MRICGVISSLAAGGAERVMLALMEAWVARGDTVTLITLAPESADHYRVPVGVQRVSLDSEAVDSAFRYGAVGANLSRLRGLRAAIRDARPDVVVSFIDRTNVRVLMATFGLGIPVIVSERTDPRHHQIGIVWSLLRQLVYRRSDALVVQTAAVRHWAESMVTAQRVHVVPNPLRPSSFPSTQPMPSRGREIVAVGRLAPEKGFDLVLGAFAQLHRQYPDWRLRIVGDGPERDALAQCAGDLVASGAVIFEGRVQDPEALLRAAQVFVLSSRYEGFPNVLLEAMAAGCACLATDCPSGPADLIVSDENGLLVPTGSTAALRDGLARLLGDASLRVRLGRAAPDRAAQFAMPAIVEAWDAVFDQVERAA